MPSVREKFPRDRDGKPIRVGDLVAFWLHDPTERHWCSLVTAIDHDRDYVITGTASRYARNLRRVMKQPTADQIERKFAAHNIDRWRAEREELRRKLMSMDRAIRDAERILR